MIFMICVCFIIVSVDVFWLIYWHVWCTITNPILIPVYAYTHTAYSHTSRPTHSYHQIYRVYPNTHTHPPLTIPQSHAPSHAYVKTSFASLTGLKTSRAAVMILTHIPFIIVAVPISCQCQWFTMLKWRKSILGLYVCMCLWLWLYLFLALLERAAHERKLNNERIVLFETYSILPPVVQYTIGDSIELPPLCTANGRPRGRSETRVHGTRRDSRSNDSDAKQ